MQKLYLLLLLLPMLLTLKPTETQAFTVTSFNDYEGVANGTPYYHSTNDEIRLDFYGSNVTTTIHAFNPPNGTVKEKVAPNNGWWVATGLTCVGTYDFTAKDRTGKILLEMTIIVEEGDLVNPKCDSGSAGEATTELTECADTICKCISDLQKPLADINNSIKETNAKLDIVNTNLTDLKEISNQINDSVKAFHDEFKSVVDYQPKSLPNTKTLLDDNSPVQPTTEFTDTTIYFEDMGSAVKPSKLPTAPEPKEWEGFTQDSPIPPELEQTKEIEQTKELEQSKEIEFSRDSENTLDVFQKDQQLIKDSQSMDTEMSLDMFSKDLEMTTDTMQQDVQMQQEVQTNTENYGQTHIYTQTNVFP